MIFKKTTLINKTKRKRLALEKNAFSVKYWPRNVVLIRLNYIASAGATFWLLYDSLFIAIVQGKSDLQ